MQVAFIADEITTFIKDHDSTWAIMQAAHELGHEVFYGHTSGLAVSGGLPSSRHYAPQDRLPRNDVSVPCGSFIKLNSDFFALQAKSQSKTLEFEKRPPVRTIPLDDFDMIFMRTDPPVDQAYMHACQILSLCKRAKVINNPRALLEHNEKLSIFNFPDLIVPTIVSADIDTIKAFIDEHAKVVVKPLDLMGGQGIFMLDREDENLDSVIEILRAKPGSKNTKPIMVQKFIPDVKITGDKRLIVINGKLEGALLRIPSQKDFRANIAAGGSYAKCKPSLRDKEICARISGFLLSNGIYFAGLDVIGDYLTEINITSPTCLQEINRLNGWTARDRLEYRLITATENT